MVQEERLLHAQSLLQQLYVLAAQQSGVSRHWSEAGRVGNNSSHLASPCSWACCFVTSRKRVTSWRWIWLWSANFPFCLSTMPPPLRHLCLDSCVSQCGKKPNFNAASGKWNRWWCFGTHAASLYAAVKLSWCFACASRRHATCPSCWMEANRFLKKHVNLSMI